MSNPSPRYVHVATHGFFFPDPEKNYDNMSMTMGNEQFIVFKMSDNPLNRAGLLFSGANTVWTGGERPEGLDDGILTAYEASNLNLWNTELVVLSACETGLGEIKGSEGVFGLQRAFMAAGANYIIMSLWKVPDKETSEFMTKFYEGLFAGQTIPEAFNTTREYMKNKYRNEPYKWAAFVLVR
jgi:CHAT domain-containing protein